MKKLKKYLGAVAAAAVLAMSLNPGKASAEAINKFPSANTGVHDQLWFYGSKAKFLSINSVNLANSKLLVTGAGFLDAICTFGGTLGKYSLAFDSAIAASGTGPNQDSLSLAISPLVFTSLDSSAAHSQNRDCWIPPYPVKFVNGLVGAQNHTGHSTIYYVHCSDGSNPCSM